MHQLEGVESGQCQSVKPHRLRQPQSMQRYRLAEPRRFLKCTHTRPALAVQSNACSWVHVLEPWRTCRAPLIENKNTARHVRKVAVLSVLRCRPENHMPHACVKGHSSMALRLDGRCSHIIWSGGTEVKHGETVRCCLRCLLVA